MNSGGPRPARVGSTAQQPSIARVGFASRHVATGCGISYNSTMINEGQPEMGKSATAETLSCPMCGATTAAGARKCLNCGEIIAVADAPKKRPFGCGTVLAVVGIGVVLVALMLPAVRRCAGEAARRSQCKNNLKQIALALHNYEAHYHALPPAYTVDGDGKPLHSWRTLILPYVDQQSLYSRIDLSKPWDDPANAEALTANVANSLHCPSTPGPAESHHVRRRGCTECLLSSNGTTAAILRSRMASQKR